jgi:hypothetical protein
MREGLLAEFTEPEALVSAIRAMRDKGYEELDAYTPYPVEQAEEALHIRRTRLPFFIFAVGLSAAGGAYFLQWFLTAYLYPLNAGGRPPHMPLAYVPITFEMGVLFAAFAAFFGLLARARLVRLWDPVFEVEGFERASIDRFWLAVDARDARFDAETTARELDELGALRVVGFGQFGRKAS